MTLYLTKDLGYSVAAAGQIISIYGLGSITGAFLGGWLSDIINPYRVQIISLTSSGIGLIILGYLTTPEEIAIFIFLVGLLSDSLRPANITAMTQVCKPNIRARGFALNRLAINLGVVIGPAVGGLLARIDYGYLFWVDGLTCLIAAILLWFFFFRQGLHLKQISTTPEEKSKTPWQDGLFLRVLFFVFILGIVFVQLFNTWPLYLRNIYQLLEDRIGLLLALNGIMIIAIEMPLVYKLEKANQLVVISIGSLLLVSGFAILPLGNTYLFAIFTVIVWTLGEILVFPMIFSFISSLASEHNRGKYMGLFSFSFAVSFIVGPALGTWIYDGFGPQYLWIFIGIIGLFVSAGFLMMNRSA